MIQGGALGAIELVDVTSRYRDGVRALDRVTLSLGRGEIGALVGPNGSGKSTALKLLAGLLPPSAGAARILGGAAGDLAARARIGFLPESPQYPAWLTVEGFLRYVGRLSGLAEDGLEVAIRRRLQWAGLAGCAGRCAAKLSTGQRQRLGLAQALLHDPPVLLLDEPAAGLDPVGVAELAGLLAGLRQEGRTVLFSSHFLAQVEAVCDRVWLFAQGRVRWTGSPAEAGSLERRYREELSHDLVS